MKQNGKAKGDINGFLEIHLFMWLCRVSAALRGIFSPRRAWDLWSSLWHVGSFVVAQGT